MAIIKHIEYKIICDCCGGDITEWTPAKNKARALKEFKIEYEKPFVKGKQFCEECEELEEKENWKEDFDYEKERAAMINAVKVDLIHNINTKGSLF